MRRFALVIFTVTIPLVAFAKTEGTPDAVAKRVVAVAGTPSQVAAVQFTFVVVEDGVERKRRSHVWCPARGLVQVTAAGLSRRVDLRKPTDADAYAWFINDSYWLFAPAKLLDHGVQRALVDDHLQLTFQQVGLTSKDRYLLSIDETGRVASWSFVLQGGRAGTYAWTDYRDVGPLSLSTRRTRADGAREIRFSDLETFDTCPF